MTLRVTRTGLAGTLTPSQAKALGASLSRRRIARLPGFLAPDLLDLIRDRLRSSRFETLANGDFDVRLVPVDPLPSTLLPLLLNDRRLFRVLEAAAGCPPILRATGRVYRMVSGRGHRVDWHADSEYGTRAVSLTVNVSARAFRGGRFQMRSLSTGSRIERSYGAPGDALLFRLDPDYQHRSTPVLGAAPKDILAAWFHTSPARRTARRAA